VNGDSSDQATPRRRYDPLLYAELYHRVEPRLHEVARAVRAGRLTRAAGRERVLAILVALNESYRAARAS
jgi:hypothetical protein